MAPATSGVDMLVPLEYASALSEDVALDDMLQ
jgi:hypothetical protein